MKKNFAIVLVLMMIVQNFSASAQRAGWNITMYGEAETDTTKYKAELFDSYKYDGDYSLSVECRVRSTSGSYSPENYIEIKTPLTQKITSGTYTLTFYSKGMTSATTLISIGGNEFKYADFSTSFGATAPSGDTGWSEYTKTFDFSGEAEELSFIYSSDTTGELLDNITLVSNGVNYIPDSGFENFGGGADEPDIPGDSGTEVEGDYTTNEYQPQNVFVTNGEDFTVLSWKNPSTSDLKNVKVYEITSGEEMLLSDDISAAPSEIIQYRPEASTYGEAYMFKIVFEFSSREAVTYYIDSGIVGRSPTAIGAWKASYARHGAAKYCPAEAGLDYENKHSGEASVRVASNIDRTKNEFKSDIYLNLSQDFKLEVGKKYKLSFWTKANNMTADLYAHFSWNKFDGCSDIHYSDFIGTYDWKYKEFTFTASNTNFIIGVDCTADSIWFDDIECYEIDNDGSVVTGVNLVEDGGFENISSEVVGEISNFEATAGIGGATVS